MELLYFFLQIAEQCFFKFYEVVINRFPQYFGVNLIIAMHQYVTHIDDVSPRDIWVRGYKLLSQLVCCFSYYSYVLEDSELK